LSERSATYSSTLCWDETAISSIRTLAKPAAVRLAWTLSRKPKKATSGLTSAVARSALPAPAAASRRSPQAVLATSAEGTQLDASSVPGRARTRKTSRSAA
jgi:hypothetical protein